MAKRTGVYVCDALELPAILCVDGSPARLIVALTPYICGKCDNRHLNIDLGEPESALSITFTPQQAEALAEKLITPFFRSIGGRRMLITYAIAALGGATGAVIAVAFWSLTQ